MLNALNEGMVNQDSQIMKLGLDFQIFQAGLLDSSILSQPLDLFV
jgi:hypothetical protein